MEWFKSKVKTESVDLPKFSYLIVLQTLQRREDAI